MFNPCSMDVKRLIVILFVFRSLKLLDRIFIGEGAKIFTHVFLNYH